VAIPPQFAKQRWGCAVCDAYPDSRQVFFDHSPAAVAKRAAAAAADRARRSTPGWTGPQRTTLPGGVWLCSAHAAAAEENGFTSFGIEEIQALRAAD